MGMLAQAMGLEPGAKGQEQLQKLMKQGKIGMDDLNKFIEIAKNRAINSGAYAAQITSRSAEQTRMSNAFSMFSDSFMMQLDESLKSSFGGVTGVLEKLTEWLDTQNKIQKETGEVGTFKFIVDYLWQIFKDFGSTLMLAIEGLGEIISIIPGLGDTKAKMKGYMAARQLEPGYFEKMGARTPAEEMKIRTQGMPGFDNYAREQFYQIDPFSTEADYANFRNILSGGLSQGNPGIILNQMNGPNIMASITSAIFSGLKDGLGSLEDKFPNLGKGSPTINNPVFNISGSGDPIATGKAVQNELNQLLIYPR